VKKYAGNTFFLPTQEEDGDDKDPGAKGSAGHNTFFIPKNIGSEESKHR